MERMNTDNVTDYKYGDLTEKILGCAFQVHNSLGCGFLERVYHKALIYEFDSVGIKFETNKRIKIFYKKKRSRSICARFYSRQ